MLNILQKSSSRILHTRKKHGFCSDTDLSLYMTPDYHLISTSHCASSHGGLIMYLSKKWDYSIKTYDTTSKIWERQIVDIFNPNANQRRKIIVGNIYRPPNNSRENFTIFINIIRVLCK